MHGQFVWYELLTPEPDASKKFYQPLTGWSTESMDREYSMWTLGGEPLGGMFHMGPAQREQGMPPNWMPYVEANNVDEIARLAGTLGGKTVVEPTDIPEHGRFAVLQDPQGATFGVYKANGASRSWDGNPTIGRFSWHELMTTDYKAAADFYRKLFGWDKTDEFDMGPLGMYYMYGLQGKPYGGMYNRTQEMEGVPPFWLPYVHVKDVKKATAMAKKAGAEVVNGPMEVPGGDWIVVMKDPQGAAFALHQAPVKGAAASASTSGQSAAQAGGSKAKAKKTVKANARKKAKAKTATRARTKAKKTAKASPRKKAAAKAKPRSRTKAKPRAKARKKAKR
jgi:predicted enzyme related to lactoylglutathione lyase